MKILLAVREIRRPKGFKPKQDKIGKVSVSLLGKNKYSREIHYLAADTLEIGVYMCEHPRHKPTLDAVAYRVAISQVYIGTVGAYVFMLMAVLPACTSDQCDVRIAFSIVREETKQSNDAPLNYLT